MRSTYNRGYDAGISGFSDAIDTQVGLATITRRSAWDVDGAEVGASFYATAYDWNGQKIISYRGTDNLVNGLLGFLDSGFTPVTSGTGTD